MAGLLDFFQSASNTAAGNLSAPVDGINWLLKKVGVPVSSAPYGGSDWMAQQGLTRPVTQSAASLAGETMGLLSPMAVAAKAPQIARGLLQMGENAMVPRTMNNQAGAVVWHGSPHKFDAFDASKIGTGEGAQSYGHGLYLADSPAVAGSYAEKLGTPSVKIGDKNYNLKNSSWVNDVGEKVPSISDLTTALNRFDQAAYSKPQAITRTESYINSNLPSYGSDETAVLRMIKDAEISSNGHTYKVDLPDAHIAKMLDWDKGGEQTWKAAVKKFGSPQAASDALASKGIPGVRYLDGSSRGLGEGMSNYVVFPGNESMLNILERNGQAIK